MLLLGCPECRRSFPASPQDIHSWVSCPYCRTDFVPETARDGESDFDIRLPPRQMENQSWVAFAIFSFVCAFATGLLFLFPVVWLLGFPVGAVGIVLGYLGYTSHRESTRNWPLVGMILNLIITLAGFTITVWRHGG